MDVIKAGDVSDPGGPGHGTGPVGVVASNALPENPMKGTSVSSPGLTGESNSGPGISGQSLGLFFIIQGGTDQPAGDGVLGQGNNGVHGVSALANGVLGENSADGTGVSGTSAKGDGVYGINGAASGAKPIFGCGIRGESVDGYGVYGASKHATGIYGTADPGHLAAEFDGDVKITGTQSVVGNANISGDCDITGKVTASDVILAGADCAEEFDVTSDAAVEPGTVVVFDQAGALCTSDQPYNRRVAGVISGAGSYRPGVILDRRISARERAAVALLGKVYCKVDASYGQIEVGDLLTTSATAGCAMKAEDPFQALGAVIGKALEPLKHGRGLIPILVALR